MKASLILAFAMLSVGCSSSKSGDPSANGSSNSRVAASENNAASAVESDPIPAAVVSKNLPGLAANAAFGKKKNVVESGGTAPPPTRIPAAENSEVATTMDSAGNFVEIRWFNNHPKLERVERVWQNDGKSTLKIYLKGGRVATASGESVKEMPAHSSIAFLELAGIKTKPQPPAEGTGAKSN